MRKIAPNLGTVIHGTLLPEDLLPALIQAAGELDILGDIDFADFKLPGLLANPSNMWGVPAYGWIDEDSEETQAYLASEDCQEDIVAIVDALDSHAYDYDMHFGAHEGDGSDFGFWQNEVEGED
jgi:hypothetical protein